MAGLLQRPFKYLCCASADILCCFMAFCHNNIQCLGSVRQIGRSIFYMVYKAFKIFEHYVKRQRKLGGFVLQYFTVYIHAIRPCKVAVAYIICYCGELAEVPCKTPCKYRTQYQPYKDGHQETYRFLHPLYNIHYLHNPWGECSCYNHKEETNNELIAYWNLCLQFASFPDYTDNWRIIFQSPLLS